MRLSWRAFREALSTRNRGASEAAGSGRRSSARGSEDKLEPDFEQDSARSGTKMALPPERRASYLGSDIAAKRLAGDNLAAMRREKAPNR